MKAKIDYDPAKFTCDQYGNLTPIDQNENLLIPVKYKNYTIDPCIGHVKIWTPSDKFFGEYPDQETAKTAIDNVQ